MAAEETAEAREPTRRFRQHRTPPPRNLSPLEDATAAGPQGFRKETPEDGALCADDAGALSSEGEKCTE